MNVTDVALAQSLRLSRTAETVIANDLANVETPGFHAQRLAWQRALGQALAKSPAAVKQVRGTLETLPGTTRPDNAATSQTLLMKELARTQLLYGLAAESWQTAQQTEQTVSHGLP